MQALDAWVRRSAPVCLAVSALGALSSGNWVRFFRLVGVAPYLSACLLHRYFGRVRLQAFHTLLRAFCQTSHREEVSHARLPPPAGRLCGTARSSACWRFTCCHFLKAVE